MRWLLRRCCFYVFALWVAVTLNFLLPRLMPGDPAGGMLARMSSAQIASNPGIIETYRRMLGGGDQSLLEAYFSYLGQIGRLDFGISTSNYPTNVSEVIGRTLPYSIFLVGVAFILAFVIGTTMLSTAPPRRQAAIMPTVVPSTNARMKATPTRKIEYGRVRAMTSETFVG